MLTIAGKTGLDEHIELFYALSQDLTRSSFPTYADGIKTKNDFIERINEGLTREDEELLLYQNDAGEVQGLIHYYWIEKDRYLSFVAFDLQRDTARAIDEFLRQVEKRFAGYQIAFGFPKENRDACSHLVALGFRKLEETECFVLHFRDYALMPEDASVLPVTEENYSAFRALHDLDPDMYWNSDRLLEGLRGKTKTPWRLYLCCENGETVGTVYDTCAQHMMEIFGFDYKDRTFRPDVMKKLMIKALNQAKADGLRHMVYFAEQEECEVLQELPVTHIAGYVCYTTEN